MKGYEVSGCLALVEWRRQADVPRAVGPGRTSGSRPDLARGGKSRRVFLVSCSSLLHDGLVCLCLNAFSGASCACSAVEARGDDPSPRQLTQQQLDSRRPRRLARRVPPHLRPSPMPQTLHDDSPSQESAPRSPASVQATGSSTHHQGRYRTAGAPNAGRASQAGHEDRQRLSSSSLRHQQVGMARRPCRLDRSSSRLSRRRASTQSQALLVKLVPRLSVQGCRDQDQSYRSCPRMRRSSRRPTRPGALRSDQQSPDRH